MYILASRFFQIHLLNHFFLKWNLKHLGFLFGLNQISNVSTGFYTPAQGISWEGMVLSSQVYFQYEELLLQKQSPNFVTLVTPKLTMICPLWKIIWKCISYKTYLIIRSCETYIASGEKEAAKWQFWKESL